MWEKAARGRPGEDPRPTVASPVHLKENVPRWRRDSYGAFSQLLRTMGQPLLIKRFRVVVWFSECVEDQVSDDVLRHYMWGCGPHLRY